MERTSKLMARCLGAGIVSAVLLAGSLVHGQQGYGLKIYHVESALYPFVHVYFRTFDEHMRPLTNLNERNVGIMVKGRAYDPAKGQYRVEPLAGRPEAIRSVLVVDGSGSMKGAPCQRALRIATAFSDSKRLQDRVAVLAVADNPQGFEVISDFEADAGAIGRRLSEVRCEGKTSRLYDTIGAAMQMAGLAWHSPGSGDPQYGVSTSIVVISDGRDEGSAISREELNTRISSLELPIPIYVLAVSTANAAHLTNLESLSKNSFGAFFSMDRVAKHAQGVIDEIQHIQKNDYVLAFRSHVPVDGEEHVLKMGVQYPTGVGGYTYQTARFEAVQPPQIPVVKERLEELDRRIPRLAKGEDPFLRLVEASTK